MWEFFHIGISQSLFSLTKMKIQPQKNNNFLLLYDIIYTFNHNVPISKVYLRCHFIFNLSLSLNAKLICVCLKYLFGVASRWFFTGKAEVVFDRCCPCQSLSFT